MHVIRRHFLAAAVDPAVSHVIRRNNYFPRIVHVRWKPFHDHVDHAVPRAPGRWTTTRPRNGTTQSQGRFDSCFACGGEYEGLLVRLPSPENNRRCG